MQKDIIINIPTGTRKNTDKPGLYVTNIIMQELSNLFKLEQYYTFNVLDSYNDKEKYLNYYLNNIYNLSLTPNKILIDKDFDIKEYMDYLVEEKMIESKPIIHELCACGRIDITEDFDNPRTKLFDIKDGKKICKMCGNECNKVSRESLIIRLKRNNNNLKIFPNKYKNSIDNQINFFSTIDYLISKERDTGIKYNYKGKLFNIDIDFVNYLMIAKEKANEKIVISSMHLTRHQALTYMISDLFALNSKYTIFLHPYLVNNDNTRDRCFSNNEKINKEIKIDDILYLLTLASNGLKKDEYKWKMDFYKKISQFKEKKYDKYVFLNKILQNEIKKIPYDYGILENRLLSYRELINDVFLKKLGDGEDEIREAIHKETNKKLCLTKQSTKR